MNYFFSFTAQGGIIAYILVFMNIIGYTIMLWKVYSLHIFSRNVKSKLPTSILLRITQTNTDRHILVESIRTEIARAFAPLNQGLTTVENIATVAPLLGLLGTVLGIFDAFGVIAKSGLDDPSAFASGIKLALITTVIGLIVAIPHVIGFNYIHSRMEQEQDFVENEVLFELGKTLSHPSLERHHA
jgi:biopolymer transport protein ExbB